MSHPVSRRAVIWSAAALLSVASAAAPVWPATASAGTAWPPDESLVRYPEEIQASQDPMRQQALRLGHAGAREFARARPRWWITIDPLTGSVERAFGDGIDLEEPTGRRFLQLYRRLMADGVESGGAELVLDERASAPLSDPAARVLTYVLRKDGLPVLGAGLSLGVREDRVVLIVSRALGPVSTSSRPRLDSGESLAAVEQALRLDRGSLTMQREPTLAYYARSQPAGLTAVLRHHLIWRLEVRPPEAPFWQVHNAWVDAHDGRLLAFFPEAQTAGSCSPDPAQARATVRGGVHPNRADDPEVVANLPFAALDLNGRRVTADINGRYPYGGGPATGTLSGDVFRIHCDNCTQPLEPLASADSSGDIDYGTGGGSSFPPVFGNGLSTPADRTAYFQLHQARLLMEKWDGVFFDEIDAFVNIFDTCNAFSLTYMLGFFAAGGNCRNTGEIRDVVQHELGHTWDRFDGNGITNGGMSEWKGDLMAIAMGGDPCIGESFRISTSFPSLFCSGVRDIDEARANRGTISVPLNPCGTSVHCLGEIAGQATWHLLNNMFNGVDYISGVPLPPGNPPLPRERARWLLERLLIGGGPPMQVLNPASAGVSIYDAVMLMDDDDGNLANGTPHAAYINPAFEHHGLAESILVPDSAGCAPLDDPMVTTLVERDPASGLPRVQIDWTPVGGATSFDVYRNARDGDAFLPLARGLTGGPYFDTGVRVGSSYRYFVAAVRRTGCADISPGTNIVTLAIVPPDLAATASFSEAPGGSDGDGRIEPGERVRVAVTLQETGGAAAATGVTASLTSASASAPVTAGGPIAFGTIPAGGSVAAPASYEVYLGPTQVCAGRAHVIVSATGNEGCWQDSFDIPLDATAGCAPTPTPFVEVVPGSLDVVGSTGDGDGIADNCEVTTASFQIRNTGAAPSGAATGTVSSAHPGVILSSTTACSVPGLAAGGSVICPFSFSLGGATASGVPFTLVADSTTNPAPSVVKTTLGSETNPPVFTTHIFDFEGSLQGWTAQQFALSTTRASGGLESAQSGSVSTPNICGKLTSPAFLLSSGGFSTLSFQMYALIEPLTDQWYDRANVHVIDLDTGWHTLVSPSSGVAYAASGNPQGGLCHIGDQAGWAGLISQFSGFTLQTFDLSAFAGRRIRIEINYDTDPGDDREGIYIDDVVLTGAAPAAPPPDTQANQCFVPEVSAESAAVPLEVLRPTPSTLRFRWQDLGAGFRYNLYGGAIGSYYSHGTGPVVCGGTGVTCNGTVCSIDRPDAALPPGDLYILVTATGFGLEGTSGFATSGAERDPGQSTCSP